EVQACKSEEYWNLAARLAGRQPPEFIAKAKSVDGKKWQVADQKTIDEIVPDVRQARFVVKRIHRREKKRYPVPPFITSKLQQDGAARRHSSVKKTMVLAQRLYEGTEIG